MSFKKPTSGRWRAQHLKRSLEGWVGNRKFGVQALFYAVILFLVGAWLPEGVEENIKYLIGDRSSWSINWKLLFSIMVLIVIGLIFKFVFPGLSSIHVRTEQPQPKKVLAVFLSPFDPWPKNQTESYQRIADLESVLEEHNLDPERVVKTTWFMPLTAIEFHKERLLEVMVFTSSGNIGTNTQFSVFQNLVQQLYPNVTVEEVVPKGLDFQDVKSVFNAVNDLYNKAISSGYREREILVDLTGGHKTNTIAAAMATLAAGREFQYINKDAFVRSYDVAYFED
jgi:hypothetical protein